MALFVSKQTHLAFNSIAIRRRSAADDDGVLRIAVRSGLCCATSFFDLISRHEASLNVEAPPIASQGRGAPMGLCVISRALSMALSNRQEGHDVPAMPPIDVERGEESIWRVVGVDHASAELDQISHQFSGSRTRLSVRLPPIDSHRRSAPIPSGTALESRESLRDRTAPVK